MRFAPFLTAAIVLAGSSAAAAPPQHWPFQFDPTLAADPASTSSELTDNESGLPTYPAASMKTLTTASTTLYMWPGNADALTRAGASGPGMMTWPTTATLCAKHGAFAIPALAPAGANAACVNAAAAVSAKLADMGACTDVEQPERYVIGYKPASPDNDNTSSIEGLVGLAGEALSHTQVPANLLPSDFVTTLRTILAKIRHDSLVSHLSQAKAAYASAITLANNACFDAAAKTTLTSALGDLSKELDDASAYLAKLDTDGKAAWAHDELCLASRSRARVGLPFPSLTEAERKFVAFWLGGVYWRMRGGGLMPLGSTQQARLFFLNAPFTQIGKLTGGQDGADAAFQIYLAVFEGWGEWMDMGTTPGGGDKYYDLVGMSARGHRQVSSAADLLAKRNYDTLDLVAGGLGMGPCYFYALDPLKDFRYAADLTTPYGPFIEGFTAVGEFCSGASIATGFAQTLLAGTPTGKPPSIDLCANKECGDDGCGVSCGTCGAGLTCTAGRCSDGSAPPSSSPPPASGGSDPPNSETPPAASPPAASDGCAIGRTSPVGSSSAVALLLAGALYKRRRARFRSERSPKPS